MITEYKCMIYLLEQGWNVLIPQGNYTKYDLVIERANKFYKIQVKHAAERETGFIVSTKYYIRGSKQKQKYTEEDCNYFMTEFKGKFYIFPNFNTVETKFWTVPPKSNNKNSKIAKDFLAENILKTL